MTGPRWAPCWPHEPCYLGSGQDQGARLPTNKTRTIRGIRNVSKASTVILYIDQTNRLNNPIFCFSRLHAPQCNDITIDCWNLICKTKNMPSEKQLMYRNIWTTGSNSKDATINVISLPNRKHEKIISGRRRCLKGFATSAGWAKLNHEPNTLYNLWI